MPVRACNDDRLLEAIMRPVLARNRCIPGCSRLCCVARLFPDCCFSLCSGLLIYQQVLAFLFLSLIRHWGSQNPVGPTHRVWLAATDSPTTRAQAKSMTQQTAAPIDTPRLLAGVRHYARQAGADPAPMLSLLSSQLGRACLQLASSDEASTTSLDSLLVNDLYKVGGPRHAHSVFPARPASCVSCMLHVCSTHARTHTPSCSLPVAAAANRCTCRACTLST